MNILHGDTAGGSFKQAFKLHQEEMLVFHDVLSCGPLAKYIGIETWRDFRKKYWNNIDQESAIESLSYGVLGRDFYSNFSHQIEQSDEYGLWIGTGLSDQLLLAFLINFITYHDLDVRKFSVFQFERIEGKNFEVQGLGLLNPDQIKHHPTPYKLNNKQIEQAQLAWEAVTENNPEKYLLYMSTEKDALPLDEKSAVVFALSVP